MDIYTTYFINGLQKFCNGFPTESDLPDHLTFSMRDRWSTALQINYGTKNVVEKPVPLQSVFEFLKTGRYTTKPHSFNALSLENLQIMPGNDKGTFSDLVKAFQSEWPKLQKLQPTAFGDTLLYLSKKYFSNAGFSPDFPHVSLHEHLKTTAALADCLERSEDNNILLVGAGLDNIQGFCYDIASSKAAKSLKGRSFFLQMLLETISTEITSNQQIQAGVGHIVYARGGKMFLLLPNSHAVRNALAEIKSSLNADIWLRYRSSLYMFLKYESFDALEGTQSDVWKRLQNKIRADRQQKNLEMLTMEFQQFFVPIEEGFRTGNNKEGSKQFCKVTGELINGADLRLHNLEADPNEEPIWVQSSVKFQSELGEALREAKEYVQWQAQTRHQIEDGNPIFTGSKTWLTVPQEGNWSLRHARPLKNDFKAQFRLKLNNLDFIPASPNGTGYGFAFYGGNEQAITSDGSRVKFFSELAGPQEDEVNSEGFTRLGIGRMDVDGLGNMAATAESSFALNATFSTRLDLFLSGYINALRASRKDYVDYLNIVFSGGDDLLIVGRWDLSLDFLSQLRADFSQFQGGDFLTMSAGLVLITPKFPIAKAVELAGKAEDAAKTHPGKNALCFLGEVISWGDEFEFVTYFSERLQKWLEPESDTGISMSLIFKIYRFFEMQEAGRHDWRWLSAWYFQQCEKGNNRSKAIFNCLKIFVMTGEWKLQEPDETVRYFKLASHRALLLLSIGGRITDFKKRNDKNLKLKS